MYISQTGETFFFTSESQNGVDGAPFTAQATSVDVRMDIQRCALSFIDDHFFFQPHREHRGSKSVKQLDHAAFLAALSRQSEHILAHNLLPTRL